MQGYAIRELISLPQIISANNKKSKEMAKEFFSKITNNIIEAEVKEAELAKLFSNAWRYIQFAASNQFPMMSKEYDCSYQNT